MFLYNFINSSPTSATYTCQGSGSALVQVMAWHLFMARPLPEPMLAYCQLDYWEPISVKFEFEFSHFHSRKCIWKCHLPEWQPFCSGVDELMKYMPNNLPSLCRTQQKFACDFHNIKSLPSGTNICYCLMLIWVIISATPCPINITSPGCHSPSDYMLLVETVTNLISPGPGNIPDELNIISTCRLDMLTLIACRLLARRVFGISHIHTRIYGQFDLQSYPSGEISWYRKHICTFHLTHSGLNKCHFANEILKFIFLNA